MNETSHQGLKMLQNKLVDFLEQENHRRRQLRRGGEEEEEEDANKLSKLPYIEKMELLQKLMKPIREPKFGLTLNDLAGTFLFRIV